MGFLTRFWDGLTSGARSFVSTSGMVEPIYFMQETDSFGRVKDPASYLQLSNTVFVCNRLRAQMLSSLTPKLYKRSTTGKRTEVTSGNLYELLQKVNPFWTFSRLIEMTEQSLGVFDQGAFWILEYGAGTSRRGLPQELWWVTPDRMSVKRDRGEYISGFEYQPPDGGRPIPFTREEVVWFRYPNVINEYMSLTPLKAAMIAADTTGAAMKSNAMLFKNGSQVAGIIGPKPGTTLTEEQARDIEQQMSRRFQGADKAHRIAVFRYETQVQSVTLSPKDAEFLGTLKWGLEEIARAYGIPIDLIGGQRTYENVNAAERGLWIRTLIPEVRFIANELTEQLLPRFPGEADLIEFDLSDVDVLQEAEREKWATDKEQIAAGVMLQNEWREDQGLKPVKWGDVWWAPSGLKPVKDAELPEPPAPPRLPLGTVTEQAPDAPGSPESGENPETALPAGETPRALLAGRRRAMDYDSPEHRAVMQRAETRAQNAEKQIGGKTAELMRRQRQAVLARLRQRSALSTREAEAVSENPFDLPRWIKTFRAEIRPIIAEILGDAGQDALDDLDVGINFDLFDPNVTRAIEKQVQRFADEVNTTTWNRLKTSLAEGFEAGESVDDLAKRVNTVMSDRIRSSAETIARTESNVAHSNADLISWEQSGVVGGKKWLSALDSRTREDHRNAHGQVVGLHEEFEVGGSRGQAPGLLGAASQDVNCRCSMTAVLDIDME